MCSDAIRQFGALFHQMGIGLHDGERQREASMPAQQLKFLKDRVKGSCSPNGVVARRVGAFETDVEPHKIALAEGASDRFGDKQGVRRQTRMQAGSGCLVEDVEQIRA